MDSKSNGLSSDQLIKFYKKMFLIRSVELKLSDLYYAAKIPGFVHLSIGQEAVSTGISENLRKTDLVGSTHRGHGHFLAKGCDLNKLMAELYGKKTGYCKGKGGSLHLFNMEDGFLGTCGIVAGGLPLATGAALALKMNKKDDIVVGYVGDGSTTEGACHEVLNMAAIWKLPVLFVCENNGYSEFSPYKEISSLTHVSDLAATYKIPTKIVDGNSVLEVYDASSELIDNIRQGNGPAFLEAMTYRWRGHYEGEDFALGDRKYRSDEEIESWKKRDPIELFKNYLFDNKIVSDDILKPVETEIHNEIEEALTFAQESPLPEVEEAFMDILD